MFVFLCRYEKARAERIMGVISFFREYFNTYHAYVIRGNAKRLHADTVDYGISNM